MSTPLKARMDFPADPDATFTLVTDPAYVEAVAEATGGQDIVVEVTPTADGGATVTSTRSLPAKVPGFAKAMVGDTLKLSEVRTYSAPDVDGTRTGTVKVTFDGVPVRVEGALVLAAHHPGSVIDLDAKISASVPFIGGKIERFASEQVEEFLKRETKVANDRLT